MVQPLTSLRYYGGKAATRKGTNAMIQRLLPPANFYCEPFFGMGGILLNRPKSKVELVNDTNGNLVAWWLEVRDNPAEFQRRVDYTPRSRELYERAYDALQDPTTPQSERALAFHILLSQGVVASPAAGRSHWGRDFQNSPHITRPDMQALATRLWGVQIDNQDAITLLRRTAQVEDGLIYCDPPYPTAAIADYGDNQVDYAALREVLLAHRCMVAISGANDEWDDLGWYRHPLDERHSEFAGAASKTRTEVLWTSYPIKESTPMGI